MLAPRNSRPATLLRPLALRVLVPLAVLVCAMAVGCDDDPPPEPVEGLSGSLDPAATERNAGGPSRAVQAASTQREPAGPPFQTARSAYGRRSGRIVAAAVSLRFVNRADAPDQASAGFDRLRGAAVFADLDRRDIDITRALVGQSSQQGQIPEPDACVVVPAGREHAEPAPVAWLQLLDVGDVRVLAGDERLDLAVSMVPSMFGAVRGVHYDGTRDQARAMLGHGTLRLIADGGDGIAPIDAAIVVPRPLRISMVAGMPVRGGVLELPAQPADLEIRWGSVDGVAALELRIAAESGAAPSWLRCRLRDDGSFTVPAAMLEPWRQRAPRSWLLTLTRSARAGIPGFPGEPLQLELVDTVRLSVAAPIEAEPAVPVEGRPRRSRAPRADRGGDGDDGGKAAGAGRD